jgi:hypothetical protein
VPTSIHRRKLPPDLRQRGQSLVELALVLPIVMLLVMITIDFGRAFFGWISLNNMARIGANYAALHSDAWGTPGSPGERTDYQTLMQTSADRVGCALVKDGSGNLPAPVFGPSVTPGDPDAWASVGLTCNFSPVAPGIRQVLGSAIKINASSTFPITYGCIKDCGAVPAPTPPPAVNNCRPLPAIAGLSVTGARRAWLAAGFTGPFNPAPGATDTRTVDTFTLAPPADADNCTGNTAFFATAISVTLVPLVTPPPSPTCVNIPNLTGMTVGEARTAWTAAGFTGAFTPTDPLNDPDIVTTQLTTPAAAIGDCVEPPAYAVAVTYTSPPPAPPAAPCKVPSLVNTPSGGAQAAWGPTGAGFTGTLTFKHSNKLPYTIKTQTLVGGTYQGCGSSMEVDN